MALKELLALADEKLHELFSKKADDPAKVRKAILKRIETTENQFKSATPVKGRKIFKIQNGVAQITLPFAIEGKSVFHVPSERFMDWLGHLKDSVTKGELDEALKSEPQAGGTATDKPKRAGWSPERRAAQAASVAARKAKK